MYTFYMKNKNSVSILLFLPLALLFFSCTDFFSTSLAPWAARNPDKLVPPVTVSNVDELISMAENNPDLSLSVLKKINEALGKDMPKKDKLKLQTASVGAAVNAAGLGQAVLGSLDDLETVLTEEDAKDLFFKALDKMDNVEDAASVLFNTLPKSGEAFDDFTKEASVDELALAAMVLICGEAKKNGDDLDGYIDNFVHNPNDTEELAIALALAAVVEERKDELSDTFKNILKSINLI